MISLPRHTCVLVLLSQICFAASMDSDLMRAVKALDIEHPICVEPVELSPGRDTFVPVANDLPGVQQYNELARLYQEQKWAEFDTAVQRFGRVYESSPLVEAALFLDVQSQIDRVRDGKGDIREVEKNLREAMVLYPKSNLRPALQASMADYWMRKGVFEKSHSLFKAAREEYPFHELSCAFQYGIAESAFFLTDLSSAKASFTQLLQKCENRRLRLGAEMRLIDIAQKQDLSSAKKYLVLYNKSPSFAAHQFPTLIYQLAESQYRAGLLREAKHYFGEYLSLSGTPKCSEFAEKRNADIALRSSQSIEEIKKAYLIAREKAPGADIGRYSNTIALLLDIKNADQPEQERRLKFLDEEIGAISNPQFRETAFLLKGLYLAELGHEDAFPYLVRYSDRTHRDINQGQVGVFLRNRLLGMLDRRLNEAEIGKTPDFDAEKANTLVDWLQKSYALWLKGTPNAESGKKLYRRLTLDSVKVALADGELEPGLDLLKRWQENDGKKAPLSAQTKGELSESILRGFMASKDPSGLSVQYLRLESDFKPFVSGPDLMHTLATIESGGQVSEKNKSFTISDLIPSRSEVKAYQAFVLGIRALKDGKAAQAARFLDLTAKSSFESKSWDARLKALTELGGYARAYGLQVSRLSKQASPQNTEILNSMVDIVRGGKLWAKGPEVLALAQKNGIEGEALERFLSLAGEASYERGECLKAVGPLERAVASEKSSDSAAGNRFRLAKCLGRLGKQGQARAVWSQLAEMNDSFWSPLAKAELSLIPQK